MTAVNSITRVAPGFINYKPANGKQMVRWLCASAVAIGALGAANTARANDVFWSVGVASPGVRVVVGNAPQVVHPQVIYPQVVYPQVVHPYGVYPQVIYPQRVVVVPQPVVVPYGHGRPMVVAPYPVVYQHGPYGHWRERHPGHGHRYGQSHGPEWRNGGGHPGRHADIERHSPGQGGGRDGGRDGNRH